MPKEIQFNEADCIGGMKEALAHAKGQLTLKTNKLPRLSQKMAPASIARSRKP